MGENNDINTYQNLYCQYDKDGNPPDPPNNPKFQCTSINALGYAINALNGQKSATLNVGQFGPDPRTSYVNTEAYLPIGAIPGEDTAYQGVYAHGIYTCVPEAEVK